MWQQSWQTWKVQVSYNKGGRTGLATEPPFPMGYIQNSWVALYCRCPSVSWRCPLEWTHWIPWSHCPAGVLLSGHLSWALWVFFCQLKVSSCLDTQVSWPSVNHNLDGHLTFLELSSGCVPGCDIIQAHASLPWMSSNVASRVARNFNPACCNEFVWGPSPIVLTCTIFYANFSGLA